MDDSYGIGGTEDLAAEEDSEGGFNDGSISVEELLAAMREQSGDPIQFDKDMEDARKWVQESLYGKKEKKL